MPPVKSQTKKVVKRQTKKVEEFAVYGAFKKPGIKRIARRAGVVRIGGLTYENVRGIAQAHLGDVIRLALIYMEYRKRRTLQYDDVKQALERLGFKAWGVNKVEKSNTSGLKKKTTGRKTRARRGAVAVREVKKYQKSTKLLLSRAGMNRLVRELIGLHFLPSSIRVSPRALSLLHVHIEDRLTNLLRNAQFIAIHAARKGVQPKNLHLVRRVQGNVSY